MSRCLLVPGFPVKILFGERWYLTGGSFRGNQLVNQNGKVVAKFNVRRQGFYLWRYGEPEPIYRGPGEDTSMNKEKKHIRLHYHYVRQEVMCGNIRLKWVSGKENPADGLTKPLGAEEHEKFRFLLEFEDNITE
jgi:hypothetical protein